MNTVRIEKNKLLATVKANREKHLAEYREATKGYWNALRKAFAGKEQDVALHIDAIEYAEDPEAELALLEKGPSAYMDRGDLPKPELHVDDYDDVIQMLEWTEDESVELEAHQFSNYVLDDWGWSHSFQMSSSNYTGKPTRSRRR